MNVLKRKKMPFFLVSTKKRSNFVLHFSINLYKLYNNDE